jgi:glutamyl-tRNA reductase
METNMYCISISYKTAPVPIRQLFAFSASEQLAFEKYIISKQQIHGCVVISTCNRSEIYFSGDKTSITIVENEVAQFKNIAPSNLRKYFHNYSKEGALRHLFQVTSGLDSMVLGEDEILRQVKDAYQLSLINKYTSNELNIAFQSALSNAKLIKTDTKLSITPVSIGTLTANQVIDFLKTNGGSNILIVGATGKIGSIVIKNLYSKSEFNIIVTSRSHDNSNELFANNDKIKIVEYSDRYHYLKMADVIVSATTSPHYTFTYQEVAKELKGSCKHKLFIDLAVPGDIDKEILTIEGTSIIDIDYFEIASKQNNLIKRKELDRAELILDGCIEETLKNIYFQEFYGNIDKVVKKVEEKGFPFILYHLKEALSSEQLKTLLDSLQNMNEENK